MRVLAYLALLGVAIAGYIWAVQWFKDRSAQRTVTNRERPQLPSSADPWPDVPAALAYGPDQGSGRLRLSVSQLVFVADTGRVTVIERLDVTGVAASRELPDRTLAQEVLVVSTPAETFYFMVTGPRNWERWLTDGG
jgi:hypothetical protein